jgi:DNA-binding NtrC family response regulator
MANILIIDNQEWVIEFCREGLLAEGYKVSATDDIESVRKNIFSFKPDLVLLNLYLKHGFVEWDVLKEIKMQGPDLPVLIVTGYYNYLFDSRLSQADGYVIKSHFQCDDLKQKIATLINRRLVAKEM